MPLQLIYTSAPRLLESGKTGFGTVARSKGLSTRMVRLLERVSQLPRNCPEENPGAVFTYRVVEIDGVPHHVLSRIVCSGSDYSGRSNHLAHHLICSQEEVDLLMRHPSGPTPAGLILALSAADFWKNQWTGSPAYLPDEFAFSARYLPNPADQATWQDLTRHKRNAILPSMPPYDEGCFILVPDSCDPATELMLNHEADWLSPDRGWGRTFTTHLCCTDMADSFLRIYMHEGSRDIQRMRRSRRPILRLHEDLHLELRQTPPQIIRADSDGDESILLPIPDPPSTPILPGASRPPSAQTIALQPHKNHRYRDSETSVAPKRASRRRVRSVTALAMIAVLGAAAAYAYHFFSGSSATSCRSAETPTRDHLPLASVRSTPQAPPARELPPPSEPAPAIPPRPQVPAPHPQPLPVPTVEAREPALPSPLRIGSYEVLSDGEPLPKAIADLFEQGKDSLQLTDLTWIDLEDGERGSHRRTAPEGTLHIIPEDSGYRIERVAENAAIPLVRLLLKDGNLLGIRTPGGHPAALTLALEANAPGEEATLYTYVPDIRLKAQLQPIPPLRFPEPQLAGRSDDWVPELDRETRTYRFAPAQIYNLEEIPRPNYLYATPSGSPAHLPVFTSPNDPSGERPVKNDISLPPGWRLDPAPEGQTPPSLVALHAHRERPVELERAAKALIDRIVNKNLSAQGGPEVSLAYIYRLVWLVHEKRDEKALSQYLNLFSKPKTRDYLRDLLGETPRSHRQQDRPARIAPPLTLAGRDAGNRIARRRVAAELRKRESTDRILAALRADIQRRLAEAGNQLPAPTAPAPVQSLILKSYTPAQGAIQWIFEPEENSPHEDSQPSGEQDAAQ